MGTIHHDFVIAVVEYNHDEVAEAFEKVKQFARDRDEFVQRCAFEAVLVGPIESVANFTQTYFMAPDGSKEGWSTSNIGNDIRAYFIETMGAAGAHVVHGSFGELTNTFGEV